MKYLILILVIVVVVMFAKAATRKDEAAERGAKAKPGGRSQGKAAAAGEQVMLACAQCGLHLPRDEALPGRGGVYCSEAHRALAESRHGSD